MNPKAQHLILAATSVAGSSKACAAKGDQAWFRVLAEYYAMVAMAVVPAEGRFVKAMGDGTLLAFPEVKVKDAVHVLKALHQDAGALWRAFEPTCHFQVKVVRGLVITGQIGAPGEERFDVVGDVVNMLYKAKWDDFSLSPDVAQLIK